MLMEIPGVISKLTEFGDTVEIHDDSDGWRELQMRAGESFAASMRLEDHPPGPCSCPPRLVSILSPSNGHYAIIGTMSVTATEADAVASAYVTFITPRLAILEIQSSRPTERGS